MNNVRLRTNSNKFYDGLFRKAETERKAKTMFFKVYLTPIIDQKKLNFG